MQIFLKKSKDSLWKQTSVRLQNTWRISLILSEKEGIFYVEVKDGELHVEPYEYYDRDAMFICQAKTLKKIAAGKLDPVLAFTTGKLKVDGSIEKALRLKEIVEKIKAGK